jgi:RimJ/RimL family protein N-acetyltransferase
VHELRGERQADHGADRASQPGHLERREAREEWLLRDDRHRVSDCCCDALQDTPGVGPGTRGGRGADDHNTREGDAAADDQLTREPLAQQPAGQHRDQDRPDVDEHGGGAGVDASLGRVERHVVDAEPPEAADQQPWPVLSARPAVVSFGMVGRYCRRVMDGWRTARLTMEPMTSAHAQEMHPVLTDPALHVFIGGVPRSPAELEHRYARLSARGSADGSEVWGNWVLRVTATGAAVGELQATLPGAGPGAGPALVAWVVGTGFQRHGYATEAAVSLVGRLRAAGWSVAADIHPDHVASQRVAAAAGLTPTTEVVDGEQRWATRGVSATPGPAG